MKVLFREEERRVLPSRRKRTRHEARKTLAKKFLRGFVDSIFQRVCGTVFFHNTVLGQVFCKGGVDSHFLINVWHSVGPGFSPKEEVIAIFQGTDLNETERW